MTPQHINHNDTIKAEYPGDDNAFRNDFMKMVHAYIDLSSYKVEGPFVFAFDIDEKGKISQLSISPKVKNYEIFSDDMQFVMRKLKTKWEPAKIHKISINSVFNFPITFRT
ncbi:hypothetical protein ACK1KB_03755 [Chryseobacterium sp. TY3]